MTPVLDRLKAGDILVCDGAMGTLLQDKGLKPGDCPELWNLDNPEAVQDIHRAYREAGSDLVECNSFGCTSFKLKHYGLESRVADLNRAAAALARNVAGDSQYVLGSVGSTGEFMEPYGTETEASIIEAFKEQMVALEEGGADLVIIETMTAIEEACAAIRAAKDNTDLIVIASFTFDPQVGGGYATMMGLRPDRAATEALAAGTDIVGTNCGTGPDDMIEIVKQLRAAAPEAPLLALPNAGMPVVENGKTVFKETPEQMAEKVPQLLEAGANIIGGCCGTGPDHIRAMRQALKA